MKPAFFEADFIEQEVKIHAILNQDIQRRLSKLIGLRHHEILKVLKTTFGDVRTPRQRYRTADRANQEELNFDGHKLDKCLYISVREAKDGDDSRPAERPTSGVLGLHVDDLEAERT